MANIKLAFPIMGYPKAKLRNKYLDKALLKTLDDIRETIVNVGHMDIIFIVYYCFIYFSIINSYLSIN